MKSRQIRKKIRQQRKEERYWMQYRTAMELGNYRQAEWFLDKARKVRRERKLWEQLQYGI